MIDEIAGDDSSTHCLTILVGSGSLAHDFEGALVISFCTEANGMLLNFEKGVPLNVENEQSSESVLDTLVPRPTRMFTILRMKNSPNSTYIIPCAQMPRVSRVPDFLSFAKVFKIIRKAARV